VPAGEFNGLPVVPFDEVEEKYPPGEFAMFVALGYHDLNALRTDRLAQARAKGYEIVSVVDRGAGLPTSVRYGENCFVMDHACVQPGVTLGENVFVWGGAMIGHHSTIGDNVWVTSNANIAGIVTIVDNTFVAVGATIANNVSVGKDCFLGANALVVKDLEDGKVVIQKPSDVIRLNSKQFLKMSKFM
jgi:sugar O-acyltransferase (sialic acid O-acetyltransferase NeuD family)